MILIFYIAAAMLIYFSYKSFRGGLDYLDYFKQELARPASDFTPFATVVAPCKGVDEGLADNLNALMAQDYPFYEVLFVVDDPDDPAMRIIKEDSRKAAKNAMTIIAPRATESSQKVENLREAVLRADERSRVFVFVDSDVRPGKNWLRFLIAPLEDETVGATTGYRWFVSENNNLAGELRSAWNASIASALGPNTNSNFCWGGSMTIRRDTFDKLQIREKWHGTLSDDFAVTRAMNAAGKAIYFVPQALTPSIESCSPRQLFEFTNRQMKITRVYAPKLWLLSFFGSGLFNSVMVAAVFILYLYRPGSIEWYAATLMLVSVIALGIGKAWLRFKAVRLVLSGSKTLDRQFFYQLTLWLFTPAVFFVNCLAALLSRRIKWRGQAYEMVSPMETKVL